MARLQWRLRLIGADRDQRLRLRLPVMSRQLDQAHYVSIRVTQARPATAIWFDRIGASGLQSIQYAHQAQVEAGGLLEHHA